MNKTIKYLLLTLFIPFLAKSSEKDNYVTMREGFETLVKENPNKNIHELDVLLWSNISEVSITEIFNSLGDRIIDKDFLSKKMPKKIAQLHAIMSLKIFFNEMNLALPSASDKQELTSSDNFIPMLPLLAKAMEKDINVTRCKDLGISTTLMNLLLLK